MSKKEKKRKNLKVITHNSKGITLVALIITIIVLLILAVVTIKAVQGDGILQYARNGAETYTKKADEENTTLEGYLELLEVDVPAENIEKATKDTMFKKTVNSPLEDKYGNKIVVPAGFKILIDDTTGYSLENIDVTKGMVIEDETGNQFVWIPVGNIYTTTEEERTEENTKTIALGRYTFSTSETTDSETGETIPIGTPTLMQPKEGTNTYKTELSIGGASELQPTESGKSTKGTAIAKNINDFYEKATKNGGFYIGRYEARKNSEGKTTCIKTDTVYNNITQVDSSSKCQNMYADNNFTSDMCNSYAWDTTTIFIQTFSGDTDYSLQKSLGSSSVGTSTDIRCNIYDMASNYLEWSTESYGHASWPYILRGGTYMSGWSGKYVSSRYALGVTTSVAITFRPILYL